MNLKNFLKLVVLVFVTKLSFGQIDTIQNRKIYNWTLNQYDQSNEYIDVDTSLYLFHNYNPILKNSITSNYLGNMGSPTQLNIFYDRVKYKTSSIFSDPYGMYFHLPKEQKYYNTKRQFTLLKYSNTGPKDESEQLLGVLHTQNVNKYWNVGIDYNLISSDGRYFNQQVRQNNITLFSSYKHKSYTLNVNYNLNGIKSQENGGIDSLHYLGANEYKNRKNIPVKLQDARSHVRSTNFYLVQEYKFGKKRTEIKITERKKESDRVRGTKKNKGSSKVGVEIENVAANKSSNSMFSEVLNDSTNDNINYDTTYVEIVEFSGFSLSHEMLHNSDVRKYFDSNLSESFYELANIYIDSSKTNDRVDQYQFGNRFAINYRKSDKLSLKFAYYNERMDYYYNIIPDTSFTLKHNIQDTSVNYIKDERCYNNSFSFYINTILFDKINLKSYWEYFIDQDKKDDSKIDTELSYNIAQESKLGISYNYLNNNPDYFYRNFSSNHFKFEMQNPKMIKQWNVGMYFENEKYKIYSEIKYGGIANYLYLDNKANVNQYNDDLKILSGELTKKIKIGLINSFTRFVYQKSSNDSILSLPQYSLYQALFLEKLWNFKATGGMLLWQIGVDYRYNSSYMADAYMPMTGLFYRQYNNEQEEFHRFDAYINLTIKRARFYIKYNYLNSAINEKYYFNSPYYPSPEPTLQFGLAWTFYD